MSRYVNYGAPVKMVHREFPGGGGLTTAEHDGADGHEHLQPGEQCACGALGLGITRDPLPGCGNNFEVFAESFERATDEPA